MAGFVAAWTAIDRFRKPQVRITTVARQWTKKELEERDKREAERQRQFDRDMQRHYWEAHPPSHVEALLIDSKGFSKTYALPFPPMPTVKMASLSPRLSAYKLGEAIPEMPQMNTIEFERRETITDPDTGAIKQIVYRERP